MARRFHSVVFQMYSYRGTFQKCYRNTFHIGKCKHWVTWPLQERERCTYVWTMEERECFFSHTARKIIITIILYNYNMGCGRWEGLKSIFWDPRWSKIIGCDRNNALYIFAVKGANVHSDFSLFFNLPSPNVVSDFIKCLSRLRTMSAC